MKILKKEELSQLKGGKVLEPKSGDVINENTVFNCICTYKNIGAVQNKNTVDGCRCSCMGK